MDGPYIGGKGRLVFRIWRQLFW